MWVYIPPGDSPGLMYYSYGPKIMFSKFHFRNPNTISCWNYGLADGLFFLYTTCIRSFFLNGIFN